MQDIATCSVITHMVNFVTIRYCPVSVLPHGSVEELGQAGLTLPDVPCVSEVPILIQAVGYANMATSIRSLKPKRLCRGADLLL
jgi:hypothetical protein